MRITEAARSGEGDGVLGTQGGTEALGQGTDEESTHYTKTKRLGLREEWPGCPGKTADMVEGRRGCSSGRISVFSEKHETIALS